MYLVPYKLNCPVFLFQYRLTPYTTTGVASAELLLKQRPCSHLDFVLPNINDIAATEKADYAI